MPMMALVNPVYDCLFRLAQPDSLSKEEEVSGPSTEDCGDGLNSECLPLSMETFTCGAGTWWGCSWSVRVTGQGLGFTQNTAQLESPGSEAVFPVGKQLGILVAQKLNWDGGPGAAGGVGLRSSLGTGPASTWPR